MAQILRVHPGTGQLDDQITIELQYDPPHRPGVPNVAHVVFHNNVEAPEFNVIAIDAQSRRLTVEARVPNDAVTGPLTVDVDGAPPIPTLQNFTVARQNPAPATVTRIVPPMGQGYRRGTAITIRLAGNANAQITGVFVARSDYGPATFQVQGAVTQQHPTSARITIPQETANHGRVKIALGPTAVYTRVLTFV